MLKLMANWIELWAWIINKLAYVAKKKNPRNVSSFLGGLQDSKASQWVGRVG